MPSSPPQQIGVLEPIASPFWSALELHSARTGARAQDTELAAISQRLSRRFYDRPAGGVVARNIEEKSVTGVFVGRP
jgi:hypothetical protein